MARVDAVEGVRVMRPSRIYETEPVGVTEQPRFLNMVVEVEIAETMTARELLRTVKQIEADMGRQSRERWGPREIDIDVLLVGEERVSEPDLEIPHPRMWERGFVVVPLADLAPEMRTPSGESVVQLAQRLEREQGVHAHL
jgi:2-amino-4-hydroxy-6-hydroxymethyldihydropteridine diphosphokinase